MKLKNPSEYTVSTDLLSNIYKELSPIVSEILKKSAKESETEPKKFINLLRRKIIYKIKIG
jgi:hypothetical protein